MATTDYCTVAEYKTQWVNLTDNIDDALIARAITASSIAVDHFCHTPGFGQQFNTRVFDTCETWRVRIDPITVINEVATDDNTDGTFETVWATTDFQPLPLNATSTGELEPYTELHATGNRTFPRVNGTLHRHGLIQVKGIWGWPAVPVPVKQATLLVVNRLVQRRNSPEGVAGFDEVGTVRISAREDPDAVRLLTPYKTTRRRGGWALA